LCWGADKRESSPGSLSLIRIVFAGGKNRFPSSVWPFVVTPFPRRWTRWSQIGDASASQRQRYYVGSSGSYLLRAQVEAQEGSFQLLRRTHFQTASGFLGGLGTNACGAARFHGLNSRNAERFLILLTATHDFFEL